MMIFWLDADAPDLRVRRENGLTEVLRAFILSYAAEKSFWDFFDAMARFPAESWHAYSNMKAVSGNRRNRRQRSAYRFRYGPDDR
jgi:hypothetical protein